MRGLNAKAEKKVQGLNWKYASIIKGNNQPDQAKILQSLHRALHVLDAPLNEYKYHVELR
jgi:hypothetical protein